MGEVEAAKRKENNQVKLLPHNLWWSQENLPWIVRVPKICSDATAHSRAVSFEVAMKGNGQKIHHKGRRCFLLVGCLSDLQAMLDYREG